MEIKKRKLNNYYNNIYLDYILSNTLASIYDNNGNFICYTTILISNFKN